MDSRATRFIESLMCAAASEANLCLLPLDSRYRPARPCAGRARYPAPDHKVYRKINVLELFRMTLIGAGVGEQSEGSESDFSIHAW